MDMLTAAAGGIPLPHHKPREQLLEELFTVQFWLQLIAILLIPSVVTYISDNSNTGFFKRAYRKWNGEAKRTIRFTFSSDYWANRSQDDRNNILQKAITIYLGQNNCKRVQTLKDGQYRLMQAQDVEENRWGSDKKNSKELKKYKLTPMPQIAQSQEIEPGLWFYYTEEADENAPLGEQAFIHRYEFTAYGRDSRTRIDDFIKRAYNAYLDGLRKELDTGRYLYQMQMSITMDGSKPPTYKKYLLSEDKTFDSLFFEQKNEILKLVDDFTAGRGKFAIEGFPNKLGLLLHGPPGTGKTSFVKALAHRTRRHIVTVPLSKLETNQALYDIMFELVFPTKDDDGVSQQLTFRDIIFLLEDIDASADVVKSRKQDAEERSAEQEEMAALMKWMMGNSNKGNNSAGAGAGGAAGSNTAATASTTGSGAVVVKYRVCTNCNVRRSAIATMPLSLWELVISFAGPKAHHNALQSCRRLQLVTNLPFPSASGWDSFFGESVFLAKGANGSVFHTRLLPHIAERLGLRGTPAVAVKVVNKTTVFSTRKWSHVVRELDAMTHCRHQHIVRLLGVFQSPDAVFIVLPFYEGGDVFDWFVARRGCTELEVRGIMRQLLLALQHMHDNCGAVHRDVKPENLLIVDAAAKNATSSRLNRPPHIVLGDFGFARVFPAAAAPRAPPIPAAVIAAMPVAAAAAARTLQAERNITAAATPCGTIGFAPPEVLRAYADRKSNAEAPAAPITPVEVMKRTDIFAAGVTMCLLLTATEPFPCHSSAANVAAVQRGIDFSARHWRHVSTAARQLVRRMLAANAEERPSAFECLASSWFVDSSSTSSGGTLSAAVPTAAATAHVDPELAATARSLRRNATTYAMAPPPVPAPAAVATPPAASSKQPAATTASDRSMKTATPPPTVPQQQTTNSNNNSNNNTNTSVAASPSAVPLRMTARDMEIADRELDRQLLQAYGAAASTTPAGGSSFALFGRTLAAAGGSGGGSFAVMGSGGQHQQQSGGGVEQSQQQQSQHANAMSNSQFTATPTGPVRGGAAATTPNRESSLTVAGAMSPAQQQQHQQQRRSNNTSFHRKSPGKNAALAGTSDPLELDCFEN